MYASSSAHGLPVRLDPMVGRREEVSLIRRLLQTSARLVTVTGGAGVGKSRVAIAAAEAMRRSVTGVWYVDLRGRGTDVATAVAQELKVDPGTGALRAIVTAIGTEETLLLLDDVDEAVAETSSVIDALLGSCPGVRAIVTSREPLTSPAQAVVNLGPFAHTELTGSSDAVRLFSDRATAGDAHFALDDETLPQVIAICTATRGVPLALELAAAQLQFMDAATLARRMGDQLETLEPAAGNSRSLRAAVEDSWERCSPVERRVWSDLSVLAAGWDLELGEAMAVLDVTDPKEATTVVKQLIRRSIVHRRRVDGGVRYELLPALREFGSEHARDPGRAEDHFVSCVLSRLHDAEDHWFSSAQHDILRRLKGDIPNIRRAVMTAASLGRTDQAIELTLTAWRQAWMIHGSGDELATWLGTALRSGKPSPFWAAQGHALGAAVFQLTGKPGLARAELATAIAALDEVAADGDPAALRACDITVRSAAEAIEPDDREAVGMLELLMADLGEEAYRFGQTNTPQRLAARLLALGDREGGTRVGDGITERALVAGDRYERSFVLTTRASAAAASGDFARTDAAAREALVVKRGLGNGLGVAQALELLADVAREQADPLRGAVLLGAAAARWREAGAIRANYPPYFFDRAATERALRLRLGDAAFERSFGYGSALSEDESVGFALHGVVEAHSRAGAAGPRTSVLTPRETQVASLVAGGASNKAIARQLFVSIRTVETHVQNALVKLGLRSRTELALWFREQAAAA